MTSLINGTDTVFTYYDRISGPSKGFRLLTSDSGPAKLILIQNCLGKRGKWMNRLHEAYKWENVGVLHCNPEILKATATLPAGVVEKLEKGAKVMKHGNKTLQKAIPFVSTAIATFRVIKGYKDGNACKEMVKVAVTHAASKTIVAEAATLGMTFGTAICPGVGTVLFGGLFAFAAGYISDKIIDIVL